jgi:hypothetical protein
MSPLMLMIILAAPPVTQPSQGPSTKPTTAAVSLENWDTAGRRKIADLEQQLIQARADALARLEASDEYKAAKADADAKEAALKRARESGSIEERFRLGKPFTVANEKLKQLRRDALQSDRGIRDTVEALARAKAELEAAKNDRAVAENDAIERDPIRRALRDRKVVVGMTVEQVESVIGTKGQTVSASGSGVVKKWTIAAQRQVIEGGVDAGQYGTYSLRCTFDGEKLVSYDQWDNHDGGAFH